MCSEYNISALQRGEVNIADVRWGGAQYRFFIPTRWLLHTFQIAAKIGGDAGPPLNNSNNAASDAFPFAAQKRQLEDAGMWPWSAVAGIRPHRDESWEKSSCWINAKCKCYPSLHCWRYSVLTGTPYVPHHCEYVIFSPGRWTGEQEDGCAEWLGFSQSTVWVHPAHLYSVYFLICDVKNEKKLTVFDMDFSLYSVPVSADLFASHSPSVIQNPSLCCPISAISAQLAALAQQRWALVAFSGLCKMKKYCVFVYVWDYS